MLARNFVVRHTRTFERRWATGPLWRREAYARQLTPSRPFHGSPRWQAKARNLKEPSERYPLSQQLAPLLSNSDRLNIVNPALCDDVLTYIGPSLEKHKGCDIIDICPGPGLWSSKLHEALQPRNHILVEPERDRYGQFLNPLIEQSGSTYRYGNYAWDEFQHYDRIMHDELGLPPLEPHDPRRKYQNNSLLVTACVGNQRIKRGKAFSSIARQLLIWFTKCAANNELFHSRGPVRMLFWIADDEKRAILPRSNTNRERTSVSLERVADIYEVAGSGDELRSGGKVTIREPQFILQSAENVAARMTSAGIEMPPHRRSQNHLLALNILSGTPNAGSNGISDPREAALSVMGPAGVTKGLIEEHEKYKEMHEQGKIPKGKHPLRMRWNSLKNTFKTRSTSRTHIQHLLEQNQEIEELERTITASTSTEEDVEAARQKWEVLCQRYHEGVKKISFHASDAALCSILAARKGLDIDPPVLMWDRRKFEPLVVNDDEFMVRKPMALLDIQPKPLISDSAAKDFERFDDFLLPLFNSGPTAPITKVLETICPGLSSQLIEKTTLLRDPARGGRLDVKDLRVCMLSTEMIEDLVNAWHEFPWRPPGAESSRYFRTKLLSGNLVT